MNIRDAYKTKETVQIPKEWKIVMLGNDEENVAEVIMGQSPPSSTYNDAGKGLPFLQGNADFGYIYPKPVMYTSKPIKIARKNDILISVRAPVGEVNLSPFKCCIGRGLSAIRANPLKLNHLFAFYYIKYSAHRLTSLATGSTFTAVRKRDLEHFNLVIPPISEQQWIASILATVDDFIQKTDDAIKKTEMLKLGLMQRILTRGVGHTKFKQTPLGKIPDTWEISTYKQVTNRITYGFTNPMPHVDSGHYLITAKDIIDGRINYETAHKTSEEAFTHLLTDKSRPEIGEVLITKDGTLGRVAIVDQEDICINQSVAVLKPNTAKISSNYLYWSLQSPWTKRNIKKEASVTTIGHISITKLGKWKFALPPIEEQSRISEILFSAKRYVDQTKLLKTKLKRLKKGLMQVLFTGKVRVKVA